MKLFFLYFFLLMCVGGYSQYHEKSPLELSFNTTLEIPVIYYSEVFKPGVGYYFSVNTLDRIYDIHCKTSMYTFGYAQLNPYSDVFYTKTNAYNFAPLRMISLSYAIKHDYDIYKNLSFLWIVQMGFVQTLFKYESASNYYEVNQTQALISPKIGLMFKNNKNWGYQYTMGFNSSLGEEFFFFFSNSVGIYYRFLKQED